MEQLNLKGQTKEEQAIEFIQKHEPPEGYMGCVSGGKDSEVLKHLTVMSGVKVQWYYSLMPDPPELLQFIKKYHSDVKIIRPKNSFWKQVGTWFPPHRFSRWCCDYIKEAPSKKIPLTHRLLGVRGEESAGRRKKGWINQFTKKRINYHPIFDWLEWEIWEYIEGNGLPHCSLYDEGFSRLGCVVCPMRSAKDTAKWRARFPPQYRLFEKCCYRWWERIGHHRQRIRGREMLFDEFMGNWYRGK